MVTNIKTDENIKTILSNLDLINDLNNNNNNITSNNDDILSNFISINENIDKDIEELSNKIINIINAKLTTQEEIFYVLNPNNLDLTKENDNKKVLARLSKKSLNIEYKFYEIKAELDNYCTNHNLITNSDKVKNLFSNVKIFADKAISEYENELSNLFLLKTLIENEINLKKSQTCIQFDLKNSYKRLHKVLNRIKNCNNYIKDINNQIAFFFNGKTCNLDEAKTLLLKFNQDITTFSNIFNQRMEYRFVNKEQLSKEKLTQKDIELKKIYEEIKKEVLISAAELDNLGYIANALDEVNSLIAKENVFLN